MMQKETDKDKSSKAVTVRMPIGLYDKIKHLALVDHRSINNEIIYMLESHEALTGWMVSADTIVKFGPPKNS